MLAEGWCPVIWSHCPSLSVIRSLLMLWGVGSSCRDPTASVRSADWPASGHCVWRHVGKTTCVPVASSTLCIIMEKLWASLLPCVYCGPEHMYCEPFRLHAESSAFVYRSHPPWMVRVLPNASKPLCRRVWAAICEDYSAGVVLQRGGRNNMFLMCSAQFGNAPVSWGFKWKDTKFAPEPAFVVSWLVMNQNLRIHAHTHVRSHSNTAFTAIAKSR